MVTENKVTKIHNCNN